MSTYTIDFMNISPDTVQVQETENTAISALVVPDDAMQFAFFDQDRNWIAPHYFVTEEVDVGDMSSLRYRHPDVHLHGDTDAEFYALVSWTHPEGSQWNGKIIVPLNESNAVVTRQGLNPVAMG
jgi:hypothetical protein